MSHVIPLVVVWLVVLTRVSMVRRPGTARVLWVTLVLLALASTLRLKAPYDWVNRVSGSLVAGSVLKVSLAVAACAGLRTLIETLPGGTRSWVRREWIVSAVAIAIVSVPVLVWPPSQVSPVATSYAEFYDSGWRSAVHWLPFLAYLGWAMAGGLTLFGRFAQHAPYQRLATGLRLVAVGCALGFVYIVLKLGALIAWHVDVAATPGWMRLAEGSVGSGVLALCIILIALGSAWEAVVARLSGSRNVVWAMWALWRLHPLWAALVALHPAIVLDAGNDRPVRRLRFRVLRRVVEIRDGVLAVEHLVNAEAVAEATARVEAEGYAGDDAAAMVLAIMVRSARPGPARPERVALAGVGGTDLSSEVRWLSQVAKDFRKAPLVQQTATELAAA